MEFNILSTQQHQILFEKKKEKEKPLGCDLDVCFFSFLFYFNKSPLVTLYFHFETIIHTIDSYTFNNNEKFT